MRIICRMVNMRLKKINNKDAYNLFLYYYIANHLIVNKIRSTLKKKEQLINKLYSIQDVTVKTVKILEEERASENIKKRNEYDNLINFYM